MPGAISKMAQELAEIADHRGMDIEVELEDEAYDIVKNFADGNGISLNEAVCQLIKRCARIRYVDGIAILDLLNEKVSPPQSR